MSGTRDLYELVWKADGISNAFYLISEQLEDELAVIRGASGDDKKALSVNLFDRLDHCYAPAFRLLMCAMDDLAKSLRVAEE